MLAGALALKSQAMNCSSDWPSLAAQSQYSRVIYVYHLFRMPAILEKEASAETNSLRDQLAEQKSLRARLRVMSPTLFDGHEWRLTICNEGPAVCRGLYIKLLGVTPEFTSPYWTRDYPITIRRLGRPAMEAPLPLSVNDEATFSLLICHVLGGETLRIDFGILQSVQEDDGHDYILRFTIVAENADNIPLLMRLQSYKYGTELSIIDRID
jgi:hypothetical protein